MFIFSVRLRLVRVAGYRETLDLLQQRRPRQFLEQLDHAGQVRLTLDGKSQRPVDGLLGAFVEVRVVAGLERARGALQTLDFALGQQVVEILLILDDQRIQMVLEGLRLGVALGQAELLPLGQPGAELLDAGDVILLQLDFPLQLVDLHLLRVDLLFQVAQRLEKHTVGQQAGAQHGQQAQDGRQQSSFA